MVPALSGAPSHVPTGETRDAGFTPQVRIATPRHLSAARVRSPNRHDARGAPGTGRVPRAPAGRPPRVGPRPGFGRRVPLPVGRHGSILPRAARRGDRGRLCSWGRVEGGGRAAPERRAAARASPVGV